MRGLFSPDHLFVWFAEKNVPWSTWPTYPGCTSTRMRASFMQSSVQRAKHYLTTQITSTATCGTPSGAPAVSRQAWRTRLKALPANTLRHSAWPFGPRRLIVHRAVWCENMMMATTTMLVQRAFHCSGVSKMCNRSSFASQREASSSSSVISLYWVSCINIGFEDKNSMKKNLLSHLIVYKHVCMGVRVCKRDIDANM